MKDKPKHKHDCKECLFLGCSDEHDLYYCNNIHPTVIARYGDNGEDYVSGIFIAALNKHLTKALLIAKQMNLDVSNKSKIEERNHHKQDIK